MKTFSQIGRELISGKRRLRFRRPQVGARPGVLVFSEDAADTTVQFICYGRDVHHVDPDNLEELLESDDHVTWIDVQGLGNPAEIQRIAQMAKIPDLMLEDIVNVPQRTHARCVNDRLLIVTQMVRLADNGKIHREQLSVYRYRNLVVTFQEEKGDVFSPLRDRLRNGRGPLRTGNADFLAYSIIDTVIDAYYPALEDTADRLQVLEQYALNHPTPTLLPFLTEARHEAVALQRAIKPQKEMLATLIRDKTGLLPPDIRSYFEDTNDHALQVADVADTLREMSVNLL
ncbi:MAG: hypothetical protein KDA78_01305, partial [Planctomycetaceae bacterium]|nr:hypothetical protein [Planctomycetaceae bacterium]